MQSPGAVRVRSNISKPITMTDLPPLPKLNLAPEYLYDEEYSWDYEESVSYDSDDDTEVNFCSSKPEPTPEPKQDFGRYLLQKRVGVNQDGTVRTENLGYFKTITNIASHLGFTYTKTHNIYKERCGASNMYLIKKMF